MKIFVLFAAMLLYFSFSLHNAVKVINYPNHGIQLPMVKVEVKAGQLSYQEEVKTNPEAIALNK